MSGLDDCCRTLVCDEADMTFVDVGLFVTNNSYRTSVEMNCRGEFFFQYFHLFFLSQVLSHNYSIVYVILTYDS